MDDLPPFTATPVDDLRGIHDRVVSTFHTHKTRDLEYRLQQLRQLYWGIKDAEPALIEALKLDLNKSPLEAMMAEVGWVLQDILFICKNLAKWMKDEVAQDIPLMNKLMKPRIRKDPLGAVLVIGAYNFPLQLTFGPAIGAIAAGCTVVIKPSENAPNTARIMQHIVSQSLDSSAYIVTQGGVPGTTALLDMKWDKIFYTGGVNVGKIIAKKAAETLTPVVLELGGRNPAIVTKHADPRLAARRCLWTKLLNAGQICISQNYIMVDREILDRFISELVAAMAEFYPNGFQGNEGYGHIINERQFDRLQSMLDSTKGKIIMGGKSDRSTLHFDPTAVLVDSADDPLIKDESFGPLIPILPVDNLDEAIRTANSVHATPLAVYTFGSDVENQRVLRETRSGGATLNDAMFHGSIPTLAFGGVGDSGQGAWHGQASFDAFTHRRSVTQTPNWMERFLDVRYPPYTASKMKQLQMMQSMKPDFDRDGNVKTSWVWWILGLGAKSGLGAGTRWAALMGLLAVMIRVYRQRPGSL